MLIVFQPLLDVMQACLRRLPQYTGVDRRPVDGVIGPAGDACHSGRRAYVTMVVLMAKGKTCRHGHGHAASLTHAFPLASSLDNVRNTACALFLSGRSATDAAFIIIARLLSIATRLFPSREWTAHDRSFSQSMVC